MKKAILIVSFGTTYTDTRTKNITAIKQQVSMFLSGYNCRRGSIKHNCKKAYAGEGIY